MTASSLAMTSPFARAFKAATTHTGSVSLLASSCPSYVEAAWLKGPKASPPSVRCQNWATTLEKKGLF